MDNRTNFIHRRRDAVPQPLGSISLQQEDHREPLAIVGPIVDCYDDQSWDQLRIVKDGLLIVDANGTIVHRGMEHDMADTGLLDKHDIRDTASQIVRLEVSNSKSSGVALQ